MPADLPAEIQQEKNKLAIKSAVLHLLDWTIEGVDRVLRFVNNTKDISYGGNTYKRCSFTLGPWENTTAGELPRRTLSVTHLDLVNYLHPYLKNYYGAVDSVVVVTPVLSEHLDVDYSSKAREHKVIHCQPAEEQIVFILGAPNPLIQKLHRKYLALYCSYVSHFKGPRCKYAGSETICNGTCVRCNELGNKPNFGGQLGQRSKTVRFA